MVSLVLHPQVSFSATSIAPNSFFGQLRTLYASAVLDAQLEQLKKTGRYDAFKLEWNPIYEEGRTHAGHMASRGPPSLFWESDIGKWVESVCYFLADEKTLLSSDLISKLRKAVDELVEMIISAQQPDGYLNIYFTVVDPAGKWKNTRDLHEMYNAGHLLEGALAHYHLTGSSKFLDVMIKNVDHIAETFGSAPDQLHGYPGHPELELVLLRLFARTKNPKYRNLAEYFLVERGQTRADLGGKRFYEWEAEQRQDVRFGKSWQNIDALWYNQSHAPLAQQETILGHSVRAFYLLTAAADFGEPFLSHAKRLWKDAVYNKQYVTGGLGSVDQWEGFSDVPHFLPQSTVEGGCYAETCASIAAMMCSERLLAHDLDGRYRDNMELCFYNAVLGGGSLDGRSFSYENHLATCGEESALRSDWFEVSCCPPNLARTLGLLGGYTWSYRILSEGKAVQVAIYLFTSATLTVPLPSGEIVSVQMESDAPWGGKTTWTVEAPRDVDVSLKVPIPSWTASPKFTVDIPPADKGFVHISPSTLRASPTFSMDAPMPVRLLAPHPLMHSDTLTVTRGPIVYVAESVDNPAIESLSRHFERIGLRSGAVFQEEKVAIQGFEVVALRCGREFVRVLEEVPEEMAFREVGKDNAVMKWSEVEEGLLLVPWFSRANRGGRGAVRTSFRRVD